MKRVTFIGDSITWGSTEGPEPSWTTQIEAHYVTSGYSFVNQGVGGATTELMRPDGVPPLDFFNRIPVSNVVTVQYGANDARGIQSYGVPPGEPMPADRYRANLFEIVDTLLLRGVSTVLVVVQPEIDPASVVGAPVDPDRILEYQDVVREMNWPDVEVVDWAASCAPFGPIPIHPNGTQSFVLSSLMRRQLDLALA